MPTVIQNGDGGGLQDVEDNGILPDLKHHSPPQTPVLLRHQHSHMRHHHEHHWGPFFEEELNATRGVLALAVPLGASIFLNCRVAMLHDKTVMWLRRSADRVSLLTVGQGTYSSDPRLAVRFQYPNNWRLHINPVQRSDEGVYLCQVSTHPPRVLTTNLTVLAPELKIADEHGHSVHDRYYKTGSTIELTCSVMTPVKLPSRQISWRKDGGPLPQKIKTSEDSTQPGGVTASRLVIPQADKTHSGTYSCSLSKDSEVFVHVHVLNGENQAAVQHDTWGSSASNHGVEFLIWILVFISCAIKCLLFNA
ncbi:zwei Ig domain protein zig-8 [Anabrus simplex]|uniref:zwei Ig domain protein zig-8 n=1 Tax=Anabrus simplex TaxID=316456 RepID=UPI0035A3C7A5